MKRQAQVYLTNVAGQEPEDADETPEVAKPASQEELAKRKFAKPRRANEIAATTGGLFRNVQLAPVTHGASAPATAESAGLFSNVKFPALAPAAAVVPAATTVATGAGTTTTDLPEEYYKQLRGLNKSVLAHLTDQVAKDEFTDLAAALDKYRTYREGIVRKFGGAVGPSAPTTAAATKPNDAAATAPPQPAEPPKLFPAPGAKFTLGVAAAPTPALGGASAPAPAPAPAFTLPPLQFGAKAAEAPAFDGVFKLPAFGGAASAFGGGKGPSLAVGAGAGAPLFGASLAFGQAPATAGAAADGGDGDDGGDGGDDDGPIPAEEPTKPDQFKKGAGEEDEDTLFELEGVKLFEKQADGKWDKLGVGLLRINENRTTKKRRLLSRSEGVGQVLLNTNLFAGMRATVVQGAKLTSVDLLCALPGKGLAHILARVATEADATKLVQAIEKFRPPQ